MKHQTMTTGYILYNESKGYLRMAEQESSFSWVADMSDATMQSGSEWDKEPNFWLGSTYIKAVGAAVRVPVRRYITTEDLPYNELSPAVRSET